MSDLIKKKDVLALVKSYIEASAERMENDGYYEAQFEGFEELQDDLFNLETFPSADIPQGEWKGYNADKGGDWLRDDGTPVFLVCDKCYGTVINNGSAHWNYCPNCGCRMKGADDE